MKRWFVLTCCVSSLLNAQEVVNLKPVTVTATGSAEEMLTQPLSIVKKDDKELKLDQVVLQKDALNSLSGVRIEQTGSVLGHMTAIRMPLNTAPYYLFLQDGIPVQSSGFFNHNALAYTTFQTAQSIEVLKGAGTALYGSDAVAAVINVSSLKKPAKSSEVTLHALGGSFGYGSANAQVSGPMNKHSGYRANVSYMHSDGYREHSKADRAEVNFRVDTNIDNSTFIKTLFSASKTVAEQADSFNDYSNIGSSLASDDANYYLALEKSNVIRKFDFAKLSVEVSHYGIEDVDIKVTPYLRYNKNRYVATWEKNLPTNNTKLATIGLLQRNSLEKDWGKLVVGFDTEYTKATQAYNQDFDVTTSGWGAKSYEAGALYDYDVDYFAIAPYLHAEYALLDAFVLTAGLRYDHNQFAYTNHLAPNSTDSSGTYFRPENREDTFSHLSPKLSIQYNIDDTANLYARYANGFRIPQASRLYSVKVGYENIRLTPEVSDTFELGVKKLFSKKSYLELALYHMSIDDTIIRDSDTGGYRNGSRSIHQGVESTLKWQLSKAFTTQLAYSYSQHHYVDDISYGSNEMAAAPNHLANARLFYTPEGLNKLTMLVEWQYVGAYWMDDEHIADKYEGYSIGNVKAQYKYSKRLEFFAKVNNVLDARYASMARYAYRKEDYTPADPRTLYGGLSYRW